MNIKKQGIILLQIITATRNLTTGFLLLFFIFLIFKTSAQSPKYSLELQTSQKEKTHLLGKLTEITTYKKAISRTIALQKFINSLREKGYLLASVDTVLFQNKKEVAQIYFGEKYEWLTVHKGNISTDLLDEISFREKHFSNKIFAFKEYQQLKTDIVTYQQNHGYPFVSIQLDSVKITENKISATLNTQLGKYILFDSLLIKGNVKIKNSFLSHYLNIVKGQPFSKKTIENIVAKIENLPYIKLEKATWIKFNQDLAYTNLSLKATKSDKVDFILGLVSDVEGKLNVTGEFLLELNNPFGNGRRIFAKGRKLKPQSQSLVFEFQQPFLFKSKLNLGLQFSLLKEDSTFLNLQRGLNLYYQTKNNEEIGFTSQLRTSRITKSRLAVESEEILPNVAKTNFLSYGINYSWRNTTPFLYPKKGSIIKVALEIGNKRITPKTEISDSLYNAISLKSTQLVLSAEIQKFIYLGKKATLFFKNSLGKMFNKQLFRNELFRLGGARLLRGFNENEFFASDFTVNTLEFRYYFDAQSFFFAFSDQSYIRTKTVNQVSKDTPFGFGVGINFMSPTGLFTLAYSLGKSRNQPLSTQFSKVHFGLISRF